MDTHGGTVERQALQQLIQSGSNLKYIPQGGGYTTRPPLRCERPRSQVLEEGNAMSYRVADAVTSVRAGDLTFGSLSLVSRPAPICARADPSPLVLTSDDLPRSALRLLHHARVVLLASAGRSFVVSLSPLWGHILRSPTLHPSAPSLCLTCIPSRPLPGVSDPLSWGSGMTGPLPIPEGPARPLPLVGSRSIEPAVSSSTVGDLILAPPRRNTLITIRVMKSRDLARLQHLVGHKMTSVRTNTTFEAHGVMKEGDGTPLNMSEIGRNYSIGPQHGVARDGPLVEPKAVSFTRRVIGGPSKHVIEVRTLAVGSKLPSVATEFLRDEILR